MSVHLRRATITRERPSTLDIAAEVLVANPTASLAQVAEAAGIGRTTLHKHYPTRQDLLVAVAHDSLDRVENAIAEAKLDTPGESTVDGLRRLVEALVPLGPRLAFLFRQPSLDDEPEIAARAERLDEPVAAFALRAQQEQVLRAGVSAWWITSTLYALVYAAWEGVALGKLAPADAPRIALDTTLAGLGFRDLTGQGGQ
ncbi:TetR/AcrR family transcriptional regulator [Amycolatopsis anabasis]|uniref:TetR/AcrR family transcriptional regulator n=1 Tax=Amycolatopsis anabasis TaxID=1840409 RepID=UPI00131ECB5E|nr:TetR/AcrR family transcriptional regulator [Amycolatopsis anabasis]